MKILYYIVIAVGCGLALKFDNGKSLGSHFWFMVGGSLVGMFYGYGDSK